MEAKSQNNAKIEKVESPSDNNQTQVTNHVVDMQNNHNYPLLKLFDDEAQKRDVQFSAYLD